jgi:hypothetical protein
MEPPGCRPVLLVVAYIKNGIWKAAVCGTKDDPAVLPDLDLAQVERICLAALAAPDPATADRTLSRLLVGQKDQLVAGLMNSGLFASHELRSGVPTRADWVAKRDAAMPLLTKRGIDLISCLGFTTETRGSTALARGTLRPVSPGFVRFLRSPSAVRTHPGRRPGPGPAHRRGSQRRAVRHRRRRRTAESLLAGHQHPPGRVGERAPDPGRGSQTSRRPGTLPAPRTPPRGADHQHRPRRTAPQRPHRPAAPAEPGDRRHGTMTGGEQPVSTEPIRPRTCTAATRPLLTAGYLGVPA